MTRYILFLYHLHKVYIPPITKNIINNVAVYIMYTTELGEHRLGNNLWEWMCVKAKKICIQKKCLRVCVCHPVMSKSESSLQLITSSVRKKEKL